MNPLIDIQNVHKTYPMGGSTVHALRGVTLQVHEGECVFLGGPSGCGKSTLLHLIGGLDKPSQGTVQVAGRSLATTPDTELSAFRASSIGFVFQNFNLLPVLTVAENVEHPLLLAAERLRPAERQRRVTAILEEVGLAGLQKQYPSQLSGGQRQRVAIARALVHEPKLLIADEPTANLDSATGEQVLALMLSLSRKVGSTLLICTHNPAFLEAAPRLVLMKDGQVASDRQLQPELPRAVRPTPAAVAAPRSSAAPQPAFMALPSEA